MPRGRDYRREFQNRKNELPPEVKELIVKPVQPKVKIEKIESAEKVEEDNGKTLRELLEEEGEKFTTKYGGILYPKSVIAAYHRVFTGTWDIFSGNPETLIDELLKEFVDSVDDKIKYFDILKTALLDKKTKTCLALRLVYASLMEETTSTITIHTVRKSVLTCQDNLIQSGNDVIFNGNSPTEMEQSELDKKAEEFYCQKSVLSEKTTGLNLTKRERLAQRVVDMGYEYIGDINVIYDELQLYKDDYEVSLIARLAFLLLLKDEGIDPKLI